MSHGILIASLYTCCFPSHIYSKEAREKIVKLRSKIAFNSLDQKKYVQLVQMNGVSYLNWELCVSCVFHCFIGEALEIDFNPLDSVSQKLSSRTSGLSFFNTLTAWSVAYEELVVVFSQFAHVLAYGAHT
jgi:hypothetical protein